MAGLAKKTNNSLDLLDLKEGYQIFADRIGLDVRLAKAVAKLGFVYPTLVQAKCLPLALQGKDILVQARTGSGKTAAFGLPTVQKVLSAKEASASGGSAAKTSVKAVILVPTRELCAQVLEQISAFLYYCNDKVSIVGLSSETVEVQAVWLRELPDIIVATPARFAVHLKSGALKLGDDLDTLVIDEADLVLSFGGEDDIREIIDYIPKTVQTMLMSATLSDDLESLKKLVLHNPVRLRLELGQSDGELRQFYVPMTEADKYLYLYALVQMRLISGKVIFFVNSTDSCYNLKLFFEQFGIKAAVLNGELPLESRKHILKQFNKGIFDFIIATDESAGIDAESEEDDVSSSSGSDSDSNSDSESNDKSNDSDSNNQSSDENEESGDGDNGQVHANQENTHKLRQKEENRTVSTATSKASSRKSDREYGVARGVDFHNVDTVVNVDFPKSSKSYVHRIGRTARGGSSGCAISLVSSDAPREIRVLARVQAAQPRGHAVDLDDIRKDISSSNLSEEADTPQPMMLPVNRSLVEGLRYRVDDVKRLVTRKAVREARVAELQREIVNSDRLQGHFEENPNDLQLLQHAGNLARRIWNPHLRTVSEYLLPKDARREPVKKSSGRGKKRKYGGKNRASIDPLQAYKIEDRAARKAFTHSTSGRTAWQRRHKKGKFSGKKKFARPSRKNAGGR